MARFVNSFSKNRAVVEKSVAWFPTLRFKLIFISVVRTIPFFTSGEIATPSRMSTLFTALPNLWKM